MNGSELNCSKSMAGQARKQLFLFSVSADVL